MANLFLFFLTVKFAVQLYLLQRNQQSIRSNLKSVPTEFESEVTLEEHQKAGKYELTKGNLSRNKIIFNLIVLVLWTVGGGIGLLTQIATNLFDSIYLQGLAFFGIYSIIELVIGLPFSLYSTFIIEEDFGFNNMTLKMFFQDLAKGLLLGVILGTHIILTLLWFMETFESSWWVLGWIFMTLFQLVLVWAFPRFIAPLFNKFQPLEEGEAKTKIEELLTETGFSHDGLFVMDASKRSNHGNAYFTGFGKTKRIVFFDTLLKQLNPNEIKSVLAHELGHFKHRHILKHMILSTIMSLIGFGILGYAYRMESFFFEFEVRTITAYNALLLFALILPVFTFFLTPLSSFLSRKNEFEADRFAAKYSDPQDLINALVKLFKENASFLVPDQFYSKFYYSHPPALERVRALRDLKTGP